MEESYAFLQADVKALYPSIRIEDGLASLNQTLLKTDMEPQERNLIIRLTKWVLTNNYMEFNNKIYIQTDGTAIGTPLAVTYAGLFMADIETRALNKIRLYKLPEPILYKRLMDDLASIHINKTSAQNFIDTLKQVLPDQIKFTYEVSDESCIFLDLVIYKHKTKHGKYKLATNLFQKKVNKYLFIPPFSNHAPHIHEGWITGYIKRLRRNCTRKIDFLLHKHTFFLRLVVRGYDKEFLIPIFQKRYNKSEITKKMDKRQDNTNQDKPIAPEMIFKIPTCQRTCRLTNKIKKCLRYTKTIKNIRNKSQMLRKSKMTPIICFKGGMNLGKRLVKAAIPSTIQKCCT